MRKIEVFFATNRQHRTEKGKLTFTDQVLDAVTASYRVGRAIVSEHQGRYKAQSYELYPERNMHSDSVADTILAREDLPPELRFSAARESVLARAGGRIKLGSHELMEAVQKQMSGQHCDVLLYIHGFAADFELCLERLAELKDKYQGDGVKEMVAFVFSWPSEGRTFPPVEYFNDRQAAEISGRAIARALCRLVEYIRSINREGRQCWQKLHLVTHSMGNWALRHALQALVNDYQRGNSLPLFENVFLMAPDEDDDALEKDYKLAPLARVAHGIHVYHSKNDLALDISDYTKSNPDRLGKHGPKNMQLTSDRVIAIDCHRVDDSKIMHGRHQYYRTRPEVVRDVVQVLAGKAPDDIEGRKMMGNHPRRFWIKAEDDA